MHIKKILFDDNTHSTRVAAGQRKNSLRENVKKQLAFLVDASAEAMTPAPEQLPDARCNASFIFNV